MSFPIATLLILLASTTPPEQLARGVIVDLSGAAVPDAAVTFVAEARERVVPVERDGTFVVPDEPGVLYVRAEGFAEVRTEIGPGGDDVRIVLQPATFADTVLVTAGRGTARLPSAASATVLSSAELSNTAAGALDDVLRQTPGFSLFRRASSRTANPTTQGVTLRGVSGSGASRTLVLADGLPLNDPFGSWVYWNRVPLAAIDRVEIVRGAAGDLYGADALGGVVQVLTFSPIRTRARATIDGGSHETARGSMFAGGTRNGWSGAVSGEALQTAGVVTIGPEIAGPVDVRADSDYRTGFATAGAQRDTWRALARLSAYHEERGNGTPVQVNSTAWRQLSGEVGGVAGGGAWEAHVASGSQDYYQTFSAPAADRRTERLTTQQWTPSEFVSASAQWTGSFGAHMLLVGTEAHHTDSTVEELRYVPVGGVNTPQGPFLVGGTERTVGLFARSTIAASDRVTVGIGLRGDFWRSTPTDQTLPEKSVSFFSPRVSLGWRTGPMVLQAAVSRAHRSPTLNELHRGFRQGNAVTNPNPLLEPETLTGVEGGVLYRSRRASVRVTGFLNSLDGAIANVTLSETPQLITRQRQNSDEIRAVGVELEADLRLHPTVVINAQTTFISSTFRGSIAVPELEGNRVPQVPRAQMAAGITWSDPRLLTAAAQVRASAAQFDDDRNRFSLGRYAVVDVMASRPLVRGVQGFAAVENLFNEEYDTVSAPRSIGWPRTARAGVRLAFP